MQNYEQPSNENLPQSSLNQKISSFESFPVSPNNPPWNGWTAFGVWAASVIFIVVFPNLFVLPYLATQTLDFSDQSAVVAFAKTNPTAVFLQILAIIPAHLCTLLLAWLVVTKIKKFSFFETLGWRRNGFKVWHSFAIFVVFYAVAVLLAKLFGEVETDFDRMLKTSRAVVYLVAFVATFTAPLIEEVIYRGVLYSAFQRKFGIVSAVFFVTVLFTAVHIPQYSNESIPNYASIITLLLLSLTLTLIRVRTKNLLPCVILHTVINGVQSIFLVLQPTIENFIKENQPAAASIFHIFK